MYDLMHGVKVVEVSSYVFIPSAGSILADWGADVVKVEVPHGGDPARSTAAVGGHADVDGVPVAPGFEVANRGKRSLGLDVSTDRGRQVLHRLIEHADVFSTSLLIGTRQKLGIDEESVRRSNPDIIYVVGSGNGRRGPDAGKGGFDLASHWARSGIAYQMTVDDGEPPNQPGSFGDLPSGLAAAGAVAAALYKRAMTGRSSSVEVSLYGTGVWMMGQAITAAGLGMPREFLTRATALSPLINYYRTKDDRWICLCFLNGDKWWPDLCRHLGIEDLVDDPRFTDEPARVANQSSCMAILDDVFQTRTFEEWRCQLADLEGVWAPLLSPAEVLEDQQALANGFVTPVTVGDGQERSYRGTASPAQFDGRGLGPLRSAPGLGEHSDQILEELGFGPTEREELRSSAVVR
jgi:crotonobetainyl-CoA:carnitine CoA-transferase CaiB-like acyl-CoA transferase